MFISECLFGLICAFAILGFVCLLIYIISSICDYCDILEQKKEKELDNKISKKVKKEISKFYNIEKRSK